MSKGTNAEAEPDESELLGDLGRARVVFGLEAQGHVPTIEEMLERGASWEGIGRAIGWCPETARRHYERILDRRTMNEGAGGALTP